MTQDSWRIEGGTPLRGTVKLSGSKNGSLPSLAATLLLDGESTLANIPRIADVETMLDLLRSFGLQVERRPPDKVHIVNRGISTHRASPELAIKMRGSHYLVGPLCARLKQAEFPLPGGCDIGDRPTGYILDALAVLGIETETNEAGMRCAAPQLTGASITLDPAYRSAGATFSVLMAAATARGTTTIENASSEPDVTCFCRLLTAAGARVTGLGTDTLRIEGVEGLRGARHAVNSDRLEAGTFLCAGIATRGDVTVSEIGWDELGVSADKLREAGVELTQEGAGLRARCADRPRGVSIVTNPFPAFSTDLQPPVVAVLATAEGESSIRETIFDHRLQHAAELEKMGANIEVQDSRSALITGVPSLHAAEVSAGNIRDGAALVIAALGAAGASIVSGRRFVARGYEDLESKLQSLGARIRVAG